jgi:hypothetical protein
LERRPLEEALPALATLAVNYQGMPTAVKKDVAALVGRLLDRLWTFDGSQRDAVMSVALKVLPARTLMLLCEEVCKARASLAAVVHPLDPTELRAIQNRIDHFESWNQRLPDTLEKAKKRRQALEALGHGPEVLAGSDAEIERLEKEIAALATEPEGPALKALKAEKEADARLLSSELILRIAEEVVPALEVLLEHRSTMDADSAQEVKALLDQVYPTLTDKQKRRLDDTSRLTLTGPPAGMSSMLALRELRDTRLD